MCMTCNGGPAHHLGSTVVIIRIGLAGANLVFEKGRGALPEIFNYI